MGHANHTAVWLNGLVYVGGGYGKYSYTIDSYNPVSNSWGSPINIPYCYFAMTTLNKTLFIAGGSDRSGKITNQIFTMDADQLKNYTTMVTARSFATAAGHQGMLMIMGGKDDDGKKLSSTELFDSTNRQWIACSDLPKPCYLLKSVIIDDTIYLLGGVDKEGRYSPAVFTASLDTLSIHQLKWNTYQDTPWCNSAPVSINGTDLLIVGGCKKIRDTHTLSSEVCKLNSISHSWETIEHLPSARDSLAAVNTPDNRVIVIGGLNDNEKKTNTVWIGSCEPE